MKITKILAIALAALTMTACSDDDKYNTASDVVVEMKDAQLLTKESATMVYLPIVVKGEANGPITVTVEMTAPEGAVAAVESKDYIVTSKTVTIPEGVESVSIEFYPTWEKGVINDDKTFDVTITNAQGAQIGDLKTTEVVIRDADKDPYNILCGTWAYYDYSYSDQVENSYSVTIEQPSEFTADGEANPDYGKVLYVYGYYQYSFMYIPLDYRYNEATEEVTLSIPLGEQMCTGGINFGSFTGIISSALYAGSTPVEKGSVPMVVSPDLNTIAMEDPETMFQVSVYSTAGAYMGFWDVIGDMTLTR